jgi:uncharacterized protein (TIGR02147 family)
MPCIINIYEYFDYRKFLADFYENKKAENRSFSYRSFARRAGFNSSGYYSDVVNQKRNLSDSLLPKFAKGLDLSVEEIRYFEQLVHFDHASTPEIKQNVFEKVIALLPLRLQKIKQAQADYFSKWHHVAIRELLAITNISENYDALANFVSPQITVKEAKQAILTLQELELIEKNTDGFWKATHSSLITRGEEIGPFLIQQYHSRMLELASESLTRHAKPDRSLSTTTMSISIEGTERIKHHIEKFQKTLIELVESDKQEDRVYQLNVQFFPLSQIPKSTEEENATQ